MKVNPITSRFYSVTQHVQRKNELKNILIKLRQCERYRPYLLIIFIANKVLSARKQIGSS